MSFHFHLDSVATYDKSLIDVDSVDSTVASGTLVQPL